MTSNEKEGKGNGSQSSPLEHDRWAVMLLFKDIEVAARQIARQLGQRMLRCGVTPQALSVLSNVPLAEIETALSRGMATTQTVSLLSMTLELPVDDLIILPPLTEDLRKEARRRMIGDNSGMMGGTGGVEVNDETELRAFLILRVLDELGMASEAISSAHA